jgi:Polyketide cyclase / dehydrase and lipid transport
MLSPISAPAFTYKHEHVTSADPAALWRLYSDVSTWPRWDDAFEAVTLDGPFEPGSSGVLKLRGQDGLAFRLVEVEPERGFVDETAIPGGAIRFRHHIEAAEGGTRLTHEVEIEAPAPVAEQLGQKITAGIPHTMARIAELAEEATP